MVQRSAGILLYRRRASGPEVFLVHPGGPFWAKKDAGAWSIPKGICDAAEEPLAAARREFAEETGATIDGELVALGDFRQAGGKIVVAFAVEGEFDPSSLRSNVFELEWPPRSGARQSFPEVDRAQWFDLETAATKITRGQVAILEALARRLGISSGR